MFVDGSTTNQICGAGLILVSPEGFQVKQAIQLSFKATNNQAEYEALIAGLNLAKNLQVQHLHIHSDSQLVVRQTSGEYATKDQILTEYQHIVIELLKSFKTCELIQVDRSENSMADMLSRLTQGEHAYNDEAVYFEELLVPSIPEKDVMEIDTSGETWMTPYINYLQEGTLPEDNIRAKQVKFHAAKYFMSKEVLYKRSSDSPILKCVDEAEGLYCMREVHEGICGDHMGAKSLAHKILRQGYYWPTLMKDCKSFVRSCHQCQLFTNMSRKPSALPASILSPIPFAIWGIDIMGPFPKAKAELQYVMVAIDYMTKWAEAKPLKTTNKTTRTTR